MYINQVYILGSINRIVKRFKYQVLSYFAHLSVVSIQEMRDFMIFIKAFKNFGAEIQNGDIMPTTQKISKPYTRKKIWTIWK